MLNLSKQYEQVWLVDFEFRVKAGSRPEPVCMVACEYFSGVTQRVWTDELLRRKEAPFRTDAKSCFMAYSANAELSCFDVLGWPQPARVIDIMVEYMNQTNGLRSKMDSYGLIAASVHFGFDSIAAAEKAGMIELILSKREYSGEEREAILDYCESDVLALKALLPCVLGFYQSNDLIQGALRGAYMKAVASQQSVGIPLDVPLLRRLQSHWPKIIARLIEDVDQQYGVFEGGTFRQRLFERYLASNQIKWPRTQTGLLCLDDETFKEMALRHLILRPLRELRRIISSVKLDKIAFGEDSRNRARLFPFKMSTSRTAYSAREHIFGYPKWARFLIKPFAGWAVAYLDWRQQEFGIAAALSGDSTMQSAYRSGDPYLAFAKQAGAVPAFGTKESHPGERALYKEAVLAVQYQMGARTLAQRLDVPLLKAQELLDAHRNAFKKYWSWTESAENCALFKGSIETCFGWRIRVNDVSNLRMIGNFPMQGNGAEMLRLACVLLLDQGVRVCASLHDAIMIEAPVERLAAAVATARDCMAEASRICLNGFELGSDVQTASFPERFEVKEGAEMWELVQSLLRSFEDCQL